MLLMMEEQLRENPGQLLPMQISADNEWDFYLDVMEKLDLPPDTGAVLVTPSAFKEMKLSEFSEFEDSEMAPWKRNAYSPTNTLIIKDNPSVVKMLIKVIKGREDLSECQNFDHVPEGNDK